MTANFDIRLDFHLTDLQQRKYTHNADDWVLYLKIECQTKTQASRIEKHIKSMKSKIYIQNLMKYPEMTQKLLTKFQEC